MKVPDKIVWYSPLNTLPVSRKQATPPLLIVAPYWAHPSTKITVKQEITADDNQWVYTGLSIPDGTGIKGLIVHYQTQGVPMTSTGIRHVRLTEVTAPTSNTPKNFVDVSTDLASSSPVKYITHFSTKKVAGALSLQLQMVFSGSSADLILLGAIGVIIE